MRVLRVCFFFTKIYSYRLCTFLRIFKLFLTLLVHYVSNLFWFSFLAHLAVACSKRLANIIVRKVFSNVITCVCTASRLGQQYYIGVSSRDKYYIYFYFYVLNFIYSFNSFSICVIV